MNLTIDGCIKITKPGKPNAYALFGTTPYAWTQSQDSIAQPIISSILEIQDDDSRDPINVAQMLCAEATAQGFTITPEVLAGPAIHRAYDLLAMDYDPFDAPKWLGDALKEIRKLMRDPAPVQTEQGYGNETD